jgi:hypothetical protein
MGFPEVVRASGVNRQDGEIGVGAEKGLDHLAIELAAARAAQLVAAAAGPREGR